jgi:hypothetical protein
MAGLILAAIPPLPPTPAMPPLYYYPSSPAQPTLSLDNSTPSIIAVNKYARRVTITRQYTFAGITTQQLYFGIDAPAGWRIVDASANMHDQFAVGVAVGRNLLGTNAVFYAQVANTGTNVVSYSIEIEPLD